jgi:hypothetical protein
MKSLVTCTLLGTFFAALLAVPRLQALELGVRTRILLSDPYDADRFTPVSEQRTFYSGQRFRLELRPNQEGFLYVLCQTSQGPARVLYPHAATDEIRAVPGRSRTLPERGFYRFDQEPGTERIYVLLAPRPIDELDQMARESRDFAPELLRKYSHLSLPAGEGELARGIDLDDEQAAQVKLIELRHEVR